MVNENSLKNLKMFSSTRQPAKNGRKPSQLKKYIHDNNVSREDVAIMIKNVLFDKSFDELSAMVQDNKTPMVIRLFVKAFLSDFKKGQLINFNYLMDRAYGSPKQDISFDGQIDVVQMTPKQREELINEYIERYNKERARDVQGSDDASDRPAGGIPGGPEEVKQEKS